MADKSKPKKELEENTINDEPIPLRFRIPVNTASLMAQHLFVQDLGEIVQLSFYEIVSPPIPPERMEENLARLRESGIVAECVARINVPASRFQSFADVMQQVAKDITFDTEIKVGNP